MRLALLVTARCNATCTHCTTDSSPRKHASLGGDDICRLMDQAAALRQPQDPLTFCISGGEPFLDIARLVKVASHGTLLGGQVTCTTNAFWASSDEKAGRVMAELKQAGLHALGVSTSRFHQQFVKPERVLRALAFARRAGVRTVLKCAVTVADRRDGWPEAFGRRANPDQLEIFPVVPYLRKDAALPAESYLREPGTPRGTCPASILTVREDGTAYTCCNPGGFAPLLSVGNALHEGLGATYARFLTQGIQHVLMRRGPAWFADRIRRRGLGHLLRPAYADVCDLCGHIAADPRLSSLARKDAERYESRQMAALFRKFKRSIRSLKRRPSGADVVSPT